MKKLLFRKQVILSFLGIIGITTLLSAFKGNSVQPVTDDLKGTINISGAFALYPIAVKWTEEFIQTILMKRRKQLLGWKTGRLRMVEQRHT